MCRGTSSAEDCQSYVIWKVPSVLIVEAFAIFLSFASAETAETEYLQVAVAIAAIPES